MDPDLPYQVLNTKKKKREGAKGLCARNLISSPSSTAMGDCFPEIGSDKNALVFDGVMARDAAERWKKRRLKREKFERIRFRTLKKLCREKAKKEKLHYNPVPFLTLKREAAITKTWTAKVGRVFLQRMDDYIDQKKMNIRRLTDLYTEKMNFERFHFVPPPKSSSTRGQTKPSSDNHIEKEDHQPLQPNQTYAVFWNLQLSSPILSFTANEIGLFSFAENVSVITANDGNVGGIIPRITSLPSFSALGVAVCLRRNENLAICASHKHSALMRIDKLPRHRLSTTSASLTFGVAIVPQSYSSATAQLAELGFGIVPHFFTFGIVAVEEDVAECSHKEHNASTSIFCCGEKRGSLMRPLAEGDVVSVTFLLPENKVEFSVYSFSSGNEAVVSFHADLPDITYTNMITIIGCTMPQSTCINLLESEANIEPPQTTLQCDDKEEEEEEEEEEAEEERKAKTTATIAFPPPDVAAPTSIVLRTSVLPKGCDEEEMQTSHVYEWKSCIAAVITKIEPVGLFIDDNSLSFRSDEVFAARIDTGDGDKMSEKWELASAIPRLGHAFAVVDMQVVRKKRCQCIYQQRGEFVWKKLSRDTSPKDGGRFLLPNFCKPVYSDILFHHFLVRTKLESQNLLPGSFKLRIEQEQQQILVAEEDLAHFARSVSSEQESWDVVSVSVLEVEFLCWK